jgi:hypothetical protein
VAWNCNRSRDGDIRRLRRACEAVTPLTVERVMRVFAGSLRRAADLYSFFMVCVRTVDRRW